MSFVIDATSELFAYETEPIQKIAWEDSDDEHIQVPIEARTKKLRHSVEESVLPGKVYTHRLREQYEKLHPKPSWAKPSLHKVKHSNSLSAPKKRALPANKISIIQKDDVNATSPSDAVVQTISTRDDLVLIAGFDKTLKLFDLNRHLEQITLDAPTEKERILQNMTRSYPLKDSYSLVSSYTIPQFPIHRAQFIPHSSMIIASSKRPFYTRIDMTTGQFFKTHLHTTERHLSLHSFTTNPTGETTAFILPKGKIAMVDSRDSLCKSILHASDSLVSVEFSPDGSMIYGLGERHSLFQWDTRRTDRPLTFASEGGLSGKALAVSSSYIATGSQAGIVSVYDRLSAAPLKSLMNLNTSITHIDFHSRGELMAMCSRSIKNAFKLVHLPSLKVYSNWPLPQSSALGYVNTFAFTQKGLLIGNDHGRVLYFHLPYE